MGLKLKISGTVILLANSVGEPCEEGAVCALLIKPNALRICRSHTPINTAET